MATVHVPQVIRSYDHNPQGSATATVRMPASNPFDRRIRVAQHLQGGALGNFFSDTFASVTSKIVDVAKTAGTAALTAVGVQPVSETPAPPVAPPAPSKPAWIMPAAVVGGALVLFMVMKKSKGRK
jgi:hypothetical protein